jgi:hypothetical protein
MARSVNTLQDRSELFKTSLWFWFVAVPTLIVIGIAIKFWFVAVPLMVVLIFWWRRKLPQWREQARERDLNRDAQKLAAARARSAEVRRRADEL